MRFRAIGELCENLAGTKKRNEMVRITADFLAPLSPEEVQTAVCMLLGRPFPSTHGESLDVSWETIAGVILQVTGCEAWEVEREFRRTGDLGVTTYRIFEHRKARQRSFVGERLGLLEVRSTLEKVAGMKGPGARSRRGRLLEGLFSRCDPLEAKYLVKVIIGEMRTGFQEGLMELAVAKAFGVSEELVREASWFAGDVSEVARMLVERGEDSIRELGPSIFRPVKPMLAEVASGVEEALEEHGGKTAFEHKLDGARVQIHKRIGEVRVFSRRLKDMTESLPEIVELVLRELKAHEAIVEGEVIAVDRSGNPLPFQALLHRFRRERGVEQAMREVPLELRLFDLLYSDGKNFLSLAYEQRRKTLEEIRGDIPLTELLETSDQGEAKAFLRKALELGHEGLVAKRIDSPYIPGRRGKLWLKVKPVLEPLDLVIVGAEFGYGRRHEWLSDYYLAARDESTGRFEIIGKTFKGLSDAEIKEMTGKLQELAVRREGRRVWVLPRVVVEVAYNEIQRSRKYPSGMALRFARITRIREDKSPEEADSLRRVKEIYERQVKKHPSF
jgi:DNA ligase-1